MSDQIANSEEQKKTVTDPVCGMQVNPATSSHHHQFKGKDYLFCSSHCLEKFKKSPQDFLQSDTKNATEKGKQEEQSDAIYTCPMHPEVKQVGPGSCPICGMALEPMTVTAGAEDDSELRDMTRRCMDRFGSRFGIP